MTDGTCHHNKSQRADPFIVLFRIITGKTKYVKDPFWYQILTKARCGKGCRSSEAFWEKWGNTGQTEAGKQSRKEVKEGD